MPWLAFVKRDRTLQHFFREGLKLLEQGHTLEAVEAFTAAIELVPDATCFFYRGLCYYTINEFDKALADYTKAIELDKESVPEVYYFRGMLQGQIGNHGEAIIDLSRAIELKGQKPITIVGWFSARLASTIWGLMI